MSRVLRSSLLLASLASLATATLGAGCARRAPPLNVVLIVIDTLRWDHVGAYGAAPHDTTPALDAFAAGAVRFERAYATAPWTRPSIGSMLTGLHPTSHGGTSVERPLPEQAETLAELLRARGYRTAGVISNWVISRKNGFAQGFDSYHEGAAVRPHAETSRTVTRIASELVAELAAQDRPFLLFAHYFDPHYRYLPHDDVDFTPGEVGVVAEHPSIFRIRELGPELTDDELANLRDLYAEEVRHADAEVGRLIAAIDAAGLAERTLIAVVSDHGEEIFERGYLGHAHSLHEELLRVPLVIRAPGLAPRVVGRPVSLVALTPTLLDLARVDHDPAHFAARSLAPLMRGESEESSAIFAEVDYLPDKRVERTAEQRAIIDARWKLVHDRQSGSDRLFDLERDPGERRDVSLRHPDVAAAMRAALEAHLGAIQTGGLASPARALSGEERDLLHELGYIEPVE